MEKVQRQRPNIQMSDTEFRMMIFSKKPILIVSLPWFLYGRYIWSIASAKTKITLILKRSWWQQQADNDIHNPFVFPQQ